MRYDENSYEDELDRMRIRNQKRAGSRNSAGSKETPQPNSQGWDDTIVFLPNSSRDRTQNSRRAASESDIKYSGNASRTGQKRRTAQTSQAHSEPDRRRTSSRHSGGHARKKKKKTGKICKKCSLFLETVL